LVLGPVPGSVSVLVWVLVLELVLALVSVLELGSAREWVLVLGPVPVLVLA
jgi:hypothetical protein